MNYIGPLLLQIALIMLNAVFAMAEIAVISMGEAKLSKLQSEGNGKAGKLLKLKSDPAKFLATIQVAITLSGFLGSAFAAENFAEPVSNLFLRFLPEDVREGVAVVIITLLLSYFSLIFGELVPKRLAMRKTEGVSLGLSGIVYFVSKVFAPIVWFLTISTNAVLRLMGIDPNADDEEVSEEDIRMMAEVSAEKGIIEEEERELIENIFNFDDVTVGALTIHRTDVVLLWMEESEQEWENTIRSSRFTMYPVCDGSIDNVVGVLDTKIYFRMEDKSRKAVLEKAIRTPYFVPEGAKADVTLRNMRQKRVSFAVVLDEYAGFSGVISIKDLIERIVGDIEDADEPAQQQQIQRIDERKWRITGNATLAVLEKEMDVDLPDDSETLSGLVFTLYGAVPEDGSTFTVEHEGIQILVTEVLEHQVTGAVITLPQTEGEKEEKED